MNMRQVTEDIKYYWMYLTKCSRSILGVKNDRHEAAILSQELVGGQQLGVSPHDSQRAERLLRK